MRVLSRTCYRAGRTRHDQEDCDEKNRIAHLPLDRADNIIENQSAALSANDHAAIHQGRRFIPALASSFAHSAELMIARHFLRHVPALGFLEDYAPAKIIQQRRWFEATNQGFHRRLAADVMFAPNKSGALRMYRPN